MSLSFAFSLLFFCCLAYEGQAGITIAPLVQITRPGQIVNFTCTSDTCYDNFFVYVNDSPYVYSLSDYTYSTCTDCMESTCTFLIFTVTTQLNDTVIVCRDRYGSITDNAHLYFAEPPQSPSPRISLLNASAFLLQWKEPVTLPYSEGVTYYKLKMYNSSGLEWRKWTIPANENYTYNYNTAVTLRAFSDVTPDNISEVSVEISVRYAPQQCNELVFYVSAGNGEGESNLRAIRGTIQTALTWSAQSLTLAQLCKADGTICILTTIAPPNVCPQRVSYSIILNCNWTSEINVTLQSNTAEKEFNYLATLAHTPKDGVYNVTVSVLVTAGNQEGTIRGVVQVEVGRGCGNDLVDWTANGLTSCSNSPPIISGCVCLILTPTLSILIGALLWKERATARRRNTANVQRRDERINPMYTETSEARGHIYEHVEKYQQ